MNVLILLLILDLLSKEFWLPVVRSHELINELPDENGFDYWMILRGPEELLAYNKEENYANDVSDPSLISTSESCLHYIFQLMGYIHECEMPIEEFFFGIKNRWISREIEPGILLEYFLLLVKRYFELIRDDDPRLYDLLEDDECEFEAKKKVAQVLLSLLNLASTDFRQNPHILPKLHSLIDAFMRQFPDAMYMVVLANFRISGFESLYLVEIIFEGIRLSIF